MARIMMGVSQQFPAAPPYYFCTAFWLMGSAELRAIGWENHAWFSPQWPGGRLPAVDALAELDKKARPTPIIPKEEPPPIVGVERSIIAGVVHGFPGIRVVLRSPRLCG